MAAAGRLSKPTTETSCGTRQPRELFTATDCGPCCDNFGVPLAPDLSDELLEEVLEELPVSD